MGFRAVVITVSDRGARGERKDGSGPEVAGILQAIGMEIVGRQIIPDEKELIRRALIEWSEEGKADLIVTTGGTGVSPRDVTPDATREVGGKRDPGDGGSNAPSEPDRHPLCDDLPRHGRHPGTDPDHQPPGKPERGAGKPQRHLARSRARHRKDKGRYEGMRIPRSIGSRKTRWNHNKMILSWHGNSQYNHCRCGNHGPFAGPGICPGRVSASG